VKILTRLFFSLFFLVSVAGSASAQVTGGGTAPLRGGTAPGPEMSAGVLGMTLAGGLLYLIKRRNRS
jgi:hypothetical protein